MSWQVGGPETRVQSSGQAGKAAASKSRMVGMENARWADESCECRARRQCTRTGLDGVPEEKASPESREHARKSASSSPFSTSSKVRVTTKVH